MDDSEQGLDLFKYLGVIIHWWWVIVVVAVLSVATAYTYSTLTKTTVYRAQATILIQESGSGRALGLSDVQASGALVSTYRELLRSPRLLRMVIDELGLPEDVEGLGKGLSISVRSGTPLLDVQVQGDDPETPVVIADTLTQAFIQDRRTTRLTEIRVLELAAEAQGIDTTALREAQLATLGSMTIITPAEIDGATAVVRPSTRRNVMLGGFLGLLVGVLLAFLVEHSGNKIKTVDQVDRLFRATDLNLSLPSLVGVVFQWPLKEVSEGTLVVNTLPSSVYSEMFRQVRTGFQFVAASNPGNAYMITSVGPREGKSTVVANLGAVLAQGGSRVIMVDGDLRRPSLHRFVGLDRRSGGLSTLLSNGQSPLSELRNTSIPALRALASGPVPVNPADLLGSPRMDQIIDELKSDCDYLLLDSPPNDGRS